QQGHRPRRRDLRQRDDRQEQLLPLQPALLHLAEHVAPDGPILGAVDPVVLLLLHREVRAKDLLQRVLLLRLLERVVGAVLRYRLVVLRLPGELLDLLVSLSDALATHRPPFPPGFPGSAAGRRWRRAGCPLRLAGAGTPRLDSGRHARRYGRK